MGDLAPEPSRPGRDRRSSRANPGATEADFARARRVARAVARRYARQGALAVVLAGSWARGDAHRFSDVDLSVVRSRARPNELLFRQGFQVSVNSTTVGIERQRMRDPRRVGGAVPGWREAVVLYDPKQVAHRLKRSAQRFTWRSLAAKTGPYLAGELAGWAEEVQKLSRALDEGNLATAAVQRNLLADAMAPLLAVELQWLYGTEHGLWERVAERMGPAWGRAQRRALGLHGEDLANSCEGAIELYGLTARALQRHVHGEARRLVRETCRRVGHPLG